MKILMVLLCLCSSAFAADVTIPPFDAGIAQMDADAMVAPAPAPAVPSDSIDDPLKAPVAAWDDVKAAKKTGWGVLALVLLIIATRLLGRLGGVFSRLKEGKVSLVIAAAGTFGLTAYNALLLGGSWVAALLGAVVAAAAAWDSAGKAKA